MSKRIFFVTIAQLLLINFLIAQIPPANTDYMKRKYLDLAYASVSPAEKLDIYLPDEGNGPFPVIVSIHGGAFMFGDKGDVQVTPMLTGIKRGYAVVSINYRMSGEAIFPKDINDVKAAIRWIKVNATQYHLNPRKIAAWGGSAGGNLAALAGTSGRIKELEDLSLGNPDQTSTVQAVVDWFGPINFLQMDEQFKLSGKGNPDHSEANSPESKILGKQITLVPELVRAANPATYITRGNPPFFIEHGKEDQLVPTQQSINFAADLTRVLDDKKVTLTLLDGTRHGGPQFEMPENLEKVFAFLDKYLK
ncbi:alpha/beta hydrolase [Mucilaginibacter flavidus]|uniref:alpha/beta hydrolase n=1 Tax=Mucilaginibacter flavidus TaxID=2949309 RepID=UPI002092DF48|nr:alpha/beta hydrolase [Mucilaginibacter flavidus]MCO5949354.1 alpha/beta hydrolase [Mucilaginibacter flavidus]